MKVAVSSSGKDLDSQIDPRFGRCAYFLIVEIDDMSFEAYDNENIALGGGAGIQSAQFVVSKGAKTVITGNCGPNAVRTLNAAGIELFVGHTGPVREALERFKTGEFRPTSEANVSDHYGMGEMGGVAQTQQGQVFGGGRGMGRGMGGGKGLGRSKGITGLSGQGPQEAGNFSKPQELDLLKKQANDLREQMEELQSRINGLEKTQ